jgi:hypothetical protein
LFISRKESGKNKKIKKENNGGKYVTNCKKWLELKKKKNGKKKRMKKKVEMRRKIINKYREESRKKKVQEGCKEKEIKEKVKRKGKKEEIDMKTINVSDKYKKKEGRLGL